MAAFCPLQSVITDGKGQFTVHPGYESSVGPPAKLLV